MGGAGAGGGRGLEAALAFARGLVTGCGCTEEGGAGVGSGWAGAAFACTTAGTGAALSTPFLVDAFKAEAAAPAVAMIVFFVKVLRTFAAADLTGSKGRVAVSMSFSISVLADPPARAWAIAAPSAFEMSTLAI